MYRVVRNKFKYLFDVVMLMCYGRYFFIFGFFFLIGNNVGWNMMLIL